MILTRCRTCLMPTTRPDTAFIGNECSACVNFKNRPTIDWKAREGELIRILEGSKNGTGYDCIVPSSGGKDSTWQTLKLIELGAKPLVVTATTCFLTPTGRKNIDNLKRFADTLEVPKNDWWGDRRWRKARAALNRIGMETVGDISLPEHMAIFSVPFRVAVEQGIPLVFYGECPQNSWGGPRGTEDNRTMTKRWVMEFGGLLGVRPSDLIGQEGLTADDIAYYTMPADADLANVTAYFLGQFVEWDSRRNAEVAEANGMTSALPYPGNWLRGENLDCALTGIHDHQCYRKFGFGRLCVQISADIRRGRIDREEALPIVRDRDGLLPETYMGVSLKDSLRHIGMSRSGFMQALDEHTNRDLFAHAENGRPILKEFAEAGCLQSA